MRERAALDQECRGILPILQRSPSITADAPPQGVDVIFMLHLCRRDLVTVKSLSLNLWT
jgi:hypothetical protein